MAETMTVADALRHIATLKGQMGEQRKRAEASVMWTETKEVGEEKPAFELKACMEKSVVVREQLVRLQAAVHHANVGAKIDWDGRSMTVDEAVRWREECKSEIKWLKDLTVQAQSKITREEFGYDDDGKRVRVVKIHHCALPEAERARLVDEAQARHDRINMLIEKSNRKTEIAV